MRIVSTNVYVGPNIYARFPVIRHVIDLGSLEDYPTGRLGDFPQRLLEALPGLQEHGCSYREPGGFVRRMAEDEGTWLGHVWEHVAHRTPGHRGYRRDIRQDALAGGEPGHYDMVYEYHEREVGLEAGRLARRLILQLLPPRGAGAASTRRRRSWDWEEERDDFIRFAQRRAFGPCTQSLVDAADARGIPWLRLNRYCLVQFGHGKYQKRIQATITSETNHISVEIASDKEETHWLLSDLGLPVPMQTLVYSERDAVRAAEKTGYPVVVKPLDANHGRGVSIRLRTPEAVETAFEVAQRARHEPRASLVESFVDGLRPPDARRRRQARRGREARAGPRRRRRRAHGRGAGRDRQLGPTPRRRPREGADAAPVRRAGRAADGEARRHARHRAGRWRGPVPPLDGQPVHGRHGHRPHRSGPPGQPRHGRARHQGHRARRGRRGLPHRRHHADRGATSAAPSWRCNAAPGFRMHVAPSEGTPRDVAGPVMDMLFPPGTPARIPIAAITGTNGKTTTTRMLAHILQMAGYTPGMTTTDGVYIDGRMTRQRRHDRARRARGMVLRDPDVDVRVLETATRRAAPVAGWASPSATWRRVSTSRADHLGHPGHRHAGRARGDQADPHRGRHRRRRAQRRRRALSRDGRAHATPSTCATSRWTRSTRSCASTSVRAAAPSCWSRA